MSSIINSIIGNNNMQVSDQTISNDMLSGSKAAATVYLNAILESATPELKTMYSGSLNQILGGHAEATKLAIDNKWYKPYDKPEQQLADIYKQSVAVVENATK